MKRLRRNFHLSKIDSTSAYLLRRRFVLRNFSTCSADYQTNGRGRENRTWESSEGQNLLLSMLISDKILCSNFNYLSVASAVAVSLTVKRYGIDCQIKWPNDVYVNGKKLCGILLESVSNEKGIESLVVGIGVNVNQTEFSNELLREPTSLKLEYGKNINVKKVKRILIKTIKKIFTEIKNNDYRFMEFAKVTDYLKGKNVVAEINGEQKSVFVLGIDDNCFLSVKYDYKIVSLNSGEITFHKN